MPNSRDYHKDIQIDPEDLENEWLNQASYYLYYAEAHADATDTRDRKKQNLELEYSVLDSKIRKSWDIKYPDTKMTESGVKSAILQSFSYKKALDLYNKASHNVNLLVVAKTAFDHRKKALENLVSLRIYDLHSTPKSPIKKQGDEIQKKQIKALNKKRQLKRSTK